MNDPAEFCLRLDRAAEPKWQRKPQTVVCGLQNLRWLQHNLPNAQCDKISLTRADKGLFTKQSQDLGRDGMSPDSLGLDISSLCVSVSLQNTAHGKAAAQHEKSLDWRGNQVSSTQYGPKSTR